MFNKYDYILVKKILIDAFKCITYKRNSYSTLVRCISNAIIKDELKPTEVLETFKLDINEFLESNKKTCIHNISMFYKRPKMLDVSLNERKTLNLRLSSNQIRSLMLIVDLVESYKEGVCNDLKERLCRSKNTSIKQYYNQLSSKGKRVFLQGMLNGT